MRLANNSTGFVAFVIDGVAGVSGLDSVMIGELVLFPKSGVKGIVLNIFETYTSVMILGNESSVEQNDIVERCSSIVSIQVSFQLLGSVVDSLGNKLATLFSFANENAGEFRKVETKAPGILTRQGVDQSLETGILAIDAMIPIGKGQRELIIGDRQTGKTTVALDCILHQRKVAESGKGQVYCVYVAIGQKRSSIVHIVERLKSEGAMAYTVVVASTSADAAALQFLAPYTGCTIGEFFRDQGLSSLVVYDDLSKQAVAYRQMALLLRRSPGREAFPGDVFYLHSRLLERAARLSNVYGGGSLTALPIVETLAGDVSAYIPTNVISITDGQIFLETALFSKGIRPAVNAGLSVSRVGSVAQCKAVKSVARNLKLELAQFREVEAFIFLGSDLDQATKNILERGLRLLEVLKQPKYQTLRIEIQIVLLFAVMKGYLDTISLAEVAVVKNTIIQVFDENPSFYAYVNINEDVKVSAPFIDALYSTLFR